MVALYAYAYVVQFFLAKSHVPILAALYSAPRRIAVANSFSTMKATLGYAANGPLITGMISYPLSRHPLKVVSHLTTGPVLSKRKTGHPEREDDGVLVMKCFS